MTLGRSLSPPIIVLPWCPKEGEEGEFVLDQGGQTCGLHHGNSALMHSHAHTHTRTSVHTHVHIRTHSSGVRSGQTCKSVTKLLPTEPSHSLRILRSRPLPNLTRQLGKKNKTQVLSSLQLQRRKLHCNFAKYHC